MCSPKHIADRDIVIQDLAKAGFVLNTKKSCFHPLQYGRFMLDLKGGSFQVPNDRVLKLNSRIRESLGTFVG